MLKFNVPDMTCGHCAGAVTKAIRNVDASATVTVDLPSQTVTIGTAAPNKDAFTQALDAAGYPAKIDASAR